MPTTEISIAGDVAPISGSFDDTLDVSFFVPCYNEERNILGAIEKLVAISSRLGLSYEILVFDDCSRDGTVDVVKRHQAANPQHPVRLFVNDVNRGVARNFFEG